MVNILLKLIGWHALVLQADPTVFDRWYYLKQHLQPGLTLDVGCGAGEMTLYAASQGNTAIGLSYDSRLNQIGQIRATMLGLPQTHFITADVQQLEFLFRNDVKFDQIICFETIEHIIADEKLLANLASLLQVKGRLILTAPYKYHQGWSTEQLSEIQDGGHVRHGYIHAELKEMLEQYNVQIISEDFISGYISQHIAQLLSGDHKVKRYFMWALTFPFRILKVGDPLITRLLQYPFLSVGIVGVKSN